MTKGVPISLHREAAKATWLSAQQSVHHHPGLGVAPRFSRPSRGRRPWSQLSHPDARLRHGIPDDLRRWAKLIERDVHRSRFPGWLLGRVPSPMGAIRAQPCAGAVLLRFLDLPWVFLGMAPKAVR